MISFSKLKGWIGYQCSVISGNRICFSKKAKIIHNYYWTMSQKKGSECETQ